MRVLLQNSKLSAEGFIIHVWDRSKEIPEGTTLTFRGMAATLFETVPIAEKVALCLVNGTPLFLVKLPDGRYFDASNEEVLVRKAVA